MYEDYNFNDSFDYDDEEVEKVPDDSDLDGYQPEIEGPW